MSHPSEYGRLRFCPKCGSDKLRRDWFPGDQPPGAQAPKDMRHPRVGCEYVCEGCGFGVWIAKSRRVLSAEMNFAQMRKRAPVKFTEACVGEEVARAYLDTKRDPPMIRTMKEKVFKKLRELGASR